MERVLVWGFSNNRAGTESVIYNYAIRMHDVAFDFLCYEAPVNYADLAAAEPNRYFVIPVKSKQPLRYTQAMRSFFHQHGQEYGALWMNINEASNIDVLNWATRLNIPVRISHMHSSRGPHSLIGRVFDKMNRKRCIRESTHLWASSEDGGNYLYHDESFHVVPNFVNARAVGFDESKRREVRCRLGVEGRFVIGMLGRLQIEKNNQWLLERMPEILQNREDAVAVFVGSGSLQPQLEEYAGAHGLADKLILTGSQKDVQAYLSAFDVYAMPSEYEGLPLALLEAQFNGLPCVISANISNEGIISTGVQRIGLDDDAAWVRALCGAQRDAAHLIPEKARIYDSASYDEDFSFERFVHMGKTR